MNTSTTPTAPPRKNDPVPSDVSTDDGNAVAKPLELKTRHRVPFEKARATITEHYGIAPTPDDLMRVWLAVAEPWQIARVFEETVLNITGSDLAGTDDDQILLSL